LNSFEYIEEPAIAAASIAQVHRARRKDGQEVAVKLQYPELAFNFEIDMFTHKTLLKALKYVCHSPTSISLTTFSFSTMT